MVINYKIFVPIHGIACFILKIYFTYKIKHLFNKVKKIYNINNENIFNKDTINYTDKIIDKNVNVIREKILPFTIKYWLFQNKLYFYQSVSVYTAHNNNDNRIQNIPFKISSKYRYSNYAFFDDLQLFISDFFLTPKIANDNIICVCKDKNDNISIFSNHINFDKVFENISVDICDFESFCMEYTYYNDEYLFPLFNVEKGSIYCFQ